MKVEVIKVVTAGEERPPLLPYRLMETYDSIDGPRIRICEGQWSTQGEAHAKAEERMLVRFKRNL